MRHDGHFSSPLPFGLCWAGCFCCFLAGELNFDLFLTSSNNLTATVESNAALEKKKLVLQMPGFLLVFIVLHLDDRQCFHARSALRQKNKFFIYYTKVMKL